ncbi:trimeric intracellular cation channel family protein [Sphingobacterium alkalisoli]|uniref:Trimeric intracellular cation channel family protein n=1 Tax=Sphingobacterium alkalisoli TaxID=1874115 RepID=A0A4U0H8S3_9SPHI|nr:trimeric intracellular cation channel family protein [Sphingobacterium alkalisoli]TJY67734.1 trimeric intracellular cation channel family protein [Sphingobacterium alkalisoli]GGH11698.1 membrane protein [Sphingobacterium alkalisoli]
MEIIYYSDLLGTMVFAISGAMAANRNGIDIFGATFTGFVTAIGGGSLRDIFLNIRPVWVEDGNYLIAIFIGVFISIVANKHLDKLARTLSLFDAIGIGFFTVVGVQKSLSYGSSDIAAIILGMFSAAMGGVIRDVLMNVTPLILRKEIYATACLSGAFLFVLLHNFHVDNGTNAFFSAALVFLIRILSVKFNLSLPSVTPIENKDLK